MARLYGHYEQEAGMEIRDKKQLSDIYDTWIMLVKNKGSNIYTIGFIGRETNEESDRLFEQDTGCSYTNYEKRGGFSEKVFISIIGGRFKYEGVMVVGTMEVLQDAEIKQALWHPGDTMYYSGGMTGLDYCVLKFTAVKGRHYCAL